MIHIRALGHLGGSNLWSSSVSFDPLHSALGQAQCERPVSVRASVGRLGLFAAASPTRPSEWCRRNGFVHTDLTILNGDRSSALDVNCGAAINTERKAIAQSGEALSGQSNKVHAPACTEVWPFHSRPQYNVQRMVCEPLWPCDIILVYCLLVGEAHTAAIGAHKQIRACVSAAREHGLA